MGQANERESADEQASRDGEEDRTEQAVAPQTLSDEWEDLLRTYHLTIRSVAGTGERGQHYIDNEWQKLEKFSLANPQYFDGPDSQYKLPQKHRNDNDGSFGFATGLGSFRGF